MSRRLVSSTFKVIESELPVEHILSEARRWEVENELGLEVLATGRVRLLAATHRAREFVEQLAVAEAGRAGPAAIDLEGRATSEWDRIVSLAATIADGGASGSRPVAQAGLNLARALLAFDSHKE